MHVKINSNIKKITEKVNRVSLTRITVVNNKFIELYDSPDIISPRAHCIVCIIKKMYQKKKKNPYKNNGPTSSLWRLPPPIYVN